MLKDILLSPLISLLNRHRRMKMVVSVEDNI
jgi:hypothetical protein